MSLDHSIETPSGRMFDFDAPTQGMVDIDDIAAALSNIARFGGLTRYRYSVAEHACAVYYLVRDAGFPPEVCVAALHHDSHEAYLGDVPTPLKRLIKTEAPGVWEDLVARVDRAICAYLRLDPELFEHDAVKAADKLVLSYEAALLKPSGAAQCKEGWVKAKVDEVPEWAVAGWPPELAHNIFWSCNQEALRACSPA